MPYELIETDDPAPRVRRITLNRPEKRNAMSNALRGELLDALRQADEDPEVSVSILRGAGPCFSSGYDLKSDLGADRPYYTAPIPGGSGSWARHVTHGYLTIWDLAKPVIAQIHGYAMAGATELAAACDLVYVADDALISHPVVRVAGTPDFGFHPWLVGMRNAMEMVLTGDPVTGEEAVRMGFANRAFPAAELEARVLEVAQRIATVPVELTVLNKRWVHAAMEIMGVRAAVRAVPDLQAALGHLQVFQGASLTDAVKAEAARPAD